MRERRLGTFVVVALLAAGAVRVQAAVREGTSIAHSREDGRVMVVSTGTEEGECSVLGSRIICHDGASYAIADIEGGCRRVARGARCAIQDESGDTVPPGLNVVDAQAGTTVDIECGEGDKKGSVYTISDGDGEGSCGKDMGVGGRVTGGTCTKNGSECASVDCESGCGSANSGCECRLKSSPKKTVQGTE